VLSVILNITHGVENGYATKFIGGVGVVIDNRV